MVLVFIIHIFCVTKGRHLKNNHEFSGVPFRCIFNDFSFLLDISSKINLHVWFYFIVFFTILYITSETGHMESSVLLSLSASCIICIQA